MRPLLRVGSGISGDGKAMAEAAITLNGRVYHLGCGDAEQARLLQLSRVVGEKLEALVQEYGQVGDDRLLLLSALMLADEMLEARAEVAALRTALDTEPARTATSGSLTAGANTASSLRAVKPT